MKYVLLHGLSNLKGAPSGARLLFSLEILLSLVAAFVGMLNAVWGGTFGCCPFILYGLVAQW